ncbi:DUF2235 domain-containing protein [Azonexus sp.]|jgi:hypothetical protein|uniref:T6SS phospholipase effector Tle1-like catalytic domain-containing protein n=1 Tax=Azonexus sp. TaxID=1872668 RepID=UPI00281D0635|nr:DUF2235 domain-containing protein [Azonexus sp.]MDR1996323.1 DUF2235 domain-containing protein [Azonexus sp.]
MSVKQAETPVTDEQLESARDEGAMTRCREELSWDKPDFTRMERLRARLDCRLYPRLSFFFDGTGNNLWEELKEPVEKRALSNVAKLYQAAIDDRVGKEAVRRYFPGVGTPYKYRFGNISPDEDKGGVLGLGFGAGGDMRLNAALSEFRYILENEWSAGALRHMQWISLSVFGFSRGATLARAFVRRLIAEQCERTADGLVWKGTFGNRVRLRIVFMGLFDTVASVGGPALHMDWGAQLAIPEEVERCLHFVSGHEVRQAFPLDSVRLGTAYPANCQEVVYPGVHSDVGGGYFDGFQGRGNLLSRIPLRDMYAEALKSGVMLHRFADLEFDDQLEMQLPSDAPLLAHYQAYMAALPPATGSLESLIQAHRTLLFRWRGAITRERADVRVLGRLCRSVDRTMCDAVPACDNHTTCAPKNWEYALPRDANEQAKQLLAEHRRLVRQIPAIRAPVERRGDMQFGRPRTDYENLIIEAWDTNTPLPDGLETFLAGHVHDSVAHFTDWPCALHEQRGIFCDGVRYLAEEQKGQSTANV